MLRSIKQLYGNKLAASDGEIGHVKDFYFEDQTWTIRYLVLDTGSWLPGRQVLVSPYSLGRLDQAEKILQVNLTRQQIEDSPPIETRKRVSRQFEEAYYRHYGWPRYWQNGGLWGTSRLPIVEFPSNPVPNAPRTGAADTRLRSTQSVKGYQVRTVEGTIGNICDFMMDAESWAIGQLVVNTGRQVSDKEEFSLVSGQWCSFKTGDRLPDKVELIPAKKVDRISYSESAIFVDMTREAAKQNSNPQPAPVGQAG
jgi:sporulation protein YlmC with PRC-barrel domain